jgi:hypothetical protein
MGKDFFEQVLGLNCALTFTGLKVASLISLKKKTFRTSIVY